MRKRHWALLVVVLGGTLLNVEMLDTPPPASAKTVVKSTHTAVMDDFISVARAYGLYPDPATLSSPSRTVAFSERQTVLLSVVTLVFIATLPRPSRTP